MCLITRLTSSLDTVSLLISVKLWVLMESQSSMESTVEIIQNIQDFPIGYSKGKPDIKFRSPFTCRIIGRTAFILLEVIRPASFISRNRFIKKQKPRLLRYLILSCMFQILRRLRILMNFNLPKQPSSISMSKVQTKSESSQAKKMAEKSKTQKNGP